ncbi:hypothetical protein MBEHAL_1267 [Halarchaeum acidiphilum MH1-52-1]|uniref:Tripartite ATP-independent periplasmic transporters DctQ component domain-containing protein n=1 Tax=Halarchaeum acidiphilum MH1-52-1 TaxID=1261545 RepID=U2YUR6_9EURY|nr:TRAP transporter small permease subunit [Halarchaeum acidiphilum]GAD52507.1 hypothetical protein MBEHAL_1267 [Halarchaeum acidiphilum MH1-52-1]
MNVTIVLFAAVVVLATVQVLVRTLEIDAFGPMAWTEPAARFTLIVGTYMGAAVATRNREHISIRFLNDRLRRRWPSLGAALNIAVILITLAFLAVALYGTVQNVASGWHTSIGGLASVTAGHVYLGIGVGLTLMVLYELGWLWSALVNLSSALGSPNAPGNPEEGN